MIRDYISLTKPGIIMGNVITAIGGFLFATHGNFSWIKFLSMILGLSLIIASGCIFNNYQDRSYDQKMNRTKNRALAKGTIPLRNAIYLACSLLVLGTWILCSLTNLLTAATALFGFIMYVNVYTPIKVKSVHGTLIGSISGAVPPVVGYCASSGRIDFAAIVLFLIIAMWQMPHFYAIAIYRLHEYSAANIPVLPAVRGIKITKIQMFFYTLAFSITAILPYVFGFSGFYYAMIASVLSLLWLVTSLKGLKAKNPNKWAHEMFRMSLIVIMGLSIAISIN